MFSNIKFIFFDVGNTLLFPNRERIHAPLTERGLTPDPELLRDLERRTKNQFDARMAENGSTDQSFWWMFYRQLLAKIGLNDDAVRDQLVSSIRQSANWDVMLPGTREQTSTNRRTLQDWCHLQCRRQNRRCPASMPPRRLLSHHH